MRYIKIIVLLLLVTTACKTNKTISEASVEKIPTKKIISNYYHNNFNQKTINARLSAKYNGSKAAATISIKLRLEKDKTIWMSATKLGIPLAKVKITPNRVTYYEKLQKTYFDGDFTLLSNWLGTELDYEKVQNILLGQAVLNLRKGRYVSSVDNKKYKISPKKNKDLYGILFFLNPSNFKLSKQEIRNTKNKQLFTVSYPKYKNINGEQFPENIQIRAIDNKNLTTIQIQYKSVEFNQNLSFPFAIPKGYKEISLK